MKRMIFSVLVLGLAVFASVPADAKKPNAINASAACLGGTVTWQPTVITGTNQLMPVAISFSDPDLDGDTIGLSVAFPTTNAPSCPFATANLPSSVSGTDTSPITDTVKIETLNSCAVKPLIYSFDVTCSESDSLNPDGSLKTQTVPVTVISR